MQQLQVDLADFLEQRPSTSVILQKIPHLFLVFGGYILHHRPRSRLTHGQVLLGTVSWTIRASATRLPTSLVLLDHGAT